MYEFFRDLDRRWIFLLMLLAVAIPILFELSFPEEATGLAQNVFEEIEKLEEGAPVLLAYDFDPGSEGELAPMATAFTLHCCQKKLKLFYSALWPVGPQMIDDAINRVIKTDFPHLEYGVDYVNLGYKPGQEGVIKVIVTDLRELYTTDDKGTNVDQIPMMEGIHSVQERGDQGVGPVRGHAVPGPDHARRRLHRGPGAAALPLHPPAAARAAGRDQGRG
ncbi:MAG: hypothetical protein ACYTES_01785 [Planctomycetota bacterium]|jgi:hypothetical protein